MYQAKYQIEVLDNTFSRLAYITKKARSKSFVITLNGAESFNCKFDFYEMLKFANDTNRPIEELLAEGQNYIRVSRRNGQFFTVRIDHLSFDLGQNTITTDVKCSGLFDILKDRFLEGPVTYTGVSQTTIIQNLLAYANAQAATGITAGNAPASTLRDRSYTTDENIREKIQQLSEVQGGPDFAVNLLRELDGYNTTIGIDRPDVIFSYGGSNGNILSLRVNRDATGIANEIFLRGDSQDANQVRATVSDAASQVKYGLRQKLSDYPSIINANELTEHGNEELKLFANPLETLELTVDGNRPPYLGQYWIGDIVRIRIPGIDYFKRLNIARFRINQMDVSVDDNDSETIRLTLGKP